MITLINHQGLKTASGLQIQTPSPSLGLAYIGAFLKRHGYTYTAIDACGEALDRIRPYRNIRSEPILIQGLTVDEVVARVPMSTRVFGFTCLFSHCWPLVVDLARALRPRFPGALFVAGGEHPTALPESVLASRLFDVAVLGEGEETFRELVERVDAGRSWRDVAGIAYSAPDGSVLSTPARRRITEIDDLPYPDWDAWSIEAYIAAHQVTGVNLGRSMPILGSRGCPFECTFCSNPDMWTQRYVMRDPVRLVDEMAHMQARYNVTGFTFMDSTFVVNRKKTLDFANELFRRNLGIHYQLPAGTRCEAFDAELAVALDRSGLRNFAFAPESGDERTLKAVKKQVSLPRLLEAVRVVLRTRMTVACFFVIGFPEDTRSGMRRTLQLIRKLAVMGVHDVTVAKFTPYPGTAYFRQLFPGKELDAAADELESVVDFYSSRGKSYTPNVSPRELYLRMIWMYTNFYVISFVMRPGRVARNFWQYFHEGIENARYMRFFSEIWYLRRKWNRSRSLSG
ncbi:MAG: B12-binding domain-containing radical SAM protein [Acidobacteria bacterium]|nr:B12-binding domain-containing radical SAM protein [Acidobacteriota bacterium]